MPEMAGMLLIPRAEVYHILLTGRDREKFDFVYIGGKRRVTRSSFENWYAGQTEVTTGTEFKQYFFKGRRHSVMLLVEGPLSTAIYFAYINPHSIRLFGSFAICNRKTILFSETGYSLRTGGALY